MEKKCQKYNIIQMLKSTLFAHIFKNVPFKMYTNIYNTPQICSGMLKIAPEALHFLKFLGGGPPPKNGPQPPFRTFPAASHPVYYSTKNNSCHFYSFIISVYISNVFASLVVQF